MLIFKRGIVSFMQQKARNNTKTVSKELYIEMYDDSFQRTKKMTILQFGFVFFLTTTTTIVIIITIMVIV